MNSLTGLGKYIFAIPIMVFGISHLRHAEAMASMAPFGGVVVIYFTGICLILFTLSVFMSKYDKLASILLFVFMLLNVLLLHLSPFMNGTEPGTSMFLKDIAIGGAALMYAHTSAKDNSIIG
ncbi:MAG: DoxX family protein [Saprospiraceae bacterium]|nr:DoxX family protein [Saprospiraceae bacterium]